jgi:streptomycin 6-kinase
MQHKLPVDFVTTMRNLYGARGDNWCQNLPLHLARLAAQWDLELGAPYVLRYNYVCRALQSQSGQQVVLKTAPDNPDFHTEVAMLRHYNGVGAISLIAADAKNAAMLLSAADPGTRLLESGLNDSQQTHIAAQLMRASFQPPTQRAPFPRIIDQAAVLTDLPARHPDAVRLIGADHHTAALHILSQQDPGATALHGDLHHENILKHDAGWIIIDPKGVIGVPAAECAAYLRNPGELLDSGIDVVALTVQRINIFAKILALPPQDIAAWNYALLVLSAWWCYEEAQTIPAHVRANLHASARVAALLAPRNA